MSLREFLKYLLIGGTFLVPFIPFLVPDSLFFPFVTGKGFAFRILVEVMLAAWVVLALLDVRYRPRFSWILTTVVAFVGIIFIADLGSENVFKSFWSNFERMEGWVLLAHLLGYFLIVSTVLNTEKLWGRFATTTVGASVIMSLYGLAQLAGRIEIRQGGDRLDGTFGNATYLAVYMLVHIFIAMLLIARWRGEAWARWVLGAAMVLQVFTLFQTETRGAILGLVGGLFVTALLFALTARNQPVIRKTGIGVVIGLLVLAGAFMPLRDTDFIQSIPGLKRVANITLEEQTVRSRFMVWDMAWQGFKEQPVLGWGQESFNYVFNKYYNPQMYDQEPWFDRVHNIFLDWLIAGGAFGLLAYLAMPLAFLYYLWLGRRRDGDVLFSPAERSILTGLLAAYAFHNIFVFDQLGSYLFFFSLLAYGHFRASAPAPESRLMLREVSEARVKAVAAPVVIVALAFALYFVNVPGMLTNTTLLKAMDAGGRQSIEQNIGLFEQALDYDALGRQEVAEQSVQFAMQAARAEHISIEERQEIATLAREAMQKEIDHAPEDARLLVFMGSFLNNLGQQEQARVFLEKASELSPQKQTMYFALGATYLRDNNFTAALEQYRTAFELAPAFEEARLRYASAAIYAGQQALANQLLEDGFGTLIVDNDNLLQAYVDTNQHDKVVGIWQLRAEENPTDPQTRISLAAAYHRAGDTARAVEEIEAVIALDPRFEAQGRQLIQQLRSGAGL